MKRTMFALLATFAVLGVACTGGGSDEPSGGSSGGVTEITLWHGYGIAGKPLPGGVVNYEAKAMDDLITEFNATHPEIKVNNVYCCTNDKALEKLTVALQGDQQPDITYQFGTSLPQIANVPNVMDLTERVKDAGFGWDDFFPGARAASTVDGRVLGIPALIDDLAIVYNKQLFKDAGVAEPTAEWTWDDFRAAAKALTDPAEKRFGWAYPVDASEDTVWHYDAMLWEAGGDILNPDNTQAVFNEAPGVTALTMLRDMAVTDQSVYLDPQNTGKIEDLFNSGSIGMLVTGPWDLSSFPDVDYGVQIMPSFPGGNHDTISGPDMWVLFDNGQQQADASWEFVTWMTQKGQIQQDAMTSGHLPTKASVLTIPGFTKAFNDKYPGNGLFAENLNNVNKARPVLAAYDQISKAMGDAIAAVLLGEKEPQAALDEAAQQVNDILASS